MHFARESIFVSAIRSFCTSFAMLLGLAFSLMLFILGIALLSLPDYMPPKSTMIIAPDADGNRKLLSSAAPVLLRLDFHGVIGLDDLTGTVLENLLLDSREDLLRNNRVKGILLHMNTPGGTVGDSDAIYRALMAYKKKYSVPIYAYVEDLCASGGMYLTSAADRMYAPSTAIIGSIGVIFGPTFNFSSAIDKLGIQSLSITAGKDKDMLNPFRPWKPGEELALQTIIDDTYAQFVDIMTKGHKRLDKQKLIDEYGAHVFLAKKAQELGYIDVANSNYAQAVRELAKAAGIAEGASYQVFHLKREHNFFEDLAQSRWNLLFSGKMTHQLRLAGECPEELRSKLLYLYSPSPLL